MIPRLTSMHGWRPLRLLVALALVSGAALFSSAPITQAARPAHICTTCPPPPTLPTIAATSDGLGHLTVTGQGFTHGGSVQIVASMPNDDMGGGGTTTTMATASLSVVHCYWPYRCFVSTGGTIATTFYLTFSCGAGINPVSVQALDTATGLWSNAVSLFPWSGC